MSLSVVPCRQCGAELTPLGGVSADVVLSRSEHCGHCRRSHAEGRSLHFCSPACLAEFLRGRSGEFFEEVGRFQGPPAPTGGPHVGRPPGW